MVETVKTFTDRDLIRIWSEHLDANEQERVVLFFARITMNPRTTIDENRPIVREFFERLDAVLQLDIGSLFGFGAESIVEIADVVSGLIGQGITGPGGGGTRRRRPR